VFEMMFAFWRKVRNVQNVYKLVH